jgi:glyoxylase-like metal-dependent hydrolase (beta-lactamase superfamily II)
MMNYYLLREDDGFTVIDTGIPGGASGIVDLAKREGAPIRRILLTHAHMDHIGSLDDLHQAAPDAEVIISEREAPLLAKDGEKVAVREGEPGDAKLRGGYPGAKTKPTRLINHGDKIGSLEAIATPGHTPGHMAYLDTRDGTLIAGDAFHTMGGPTVASVFKLIFPLPVMATWHKGKATESAEALLEYRPQRLAVGHGPVVDNPLSAMKEAVEVARRKTG